ncbi:MAG: hypothetical protein JNM62_03110 [Flavobacteriales bacterium]|nr:hypothetical protein [Flavobacteriales bacterium]
MRVTAAVATSFYACAAPDDGLDRPIARAFDQVLHWSDLRQVIPVDATPKDSAAFAQQYIDSWMHQQVVLHTAELNQPDQGMDMEAQIEDYRRSLVIFNYEQALVDQKLDTAVTGAEIEAYYEAHRTDFELKDDMIRARWFKVNEADRRVIRRMEQRFISGGGEELREVEVWLAQRGVAIIDRSSSWIPASELKAEVQQDAVQDVIVSDGKVVLVDGTSAWFVEVLEHRSRNSVSPLELVRPDIRAILLNQRKLKLIADMRRSVYEQAQKNQDVETFAP